MIWCIVYSCCLLRRVGLLRRDFGLFFIIKLDYGEKPHLNDHQAQHDDHFNVPIHQFFFDVRVTRLICIVVLELRAMTEKNSRRWW